MKSLPAILLDIAQWDASTYETRRDIAQLVAQKLGPDYMYVGFKDYEAGGQRHQIMAIEHQPSLLVFHLIPGGKFELGRSEDEDAICEANGWKGDLPEEPTTRVRIEPYLIACTPVTEQAMKGFKPDGPEGWKCGQFHAADVISRKDARAWCKQYGMRLPTEPEWEYACRAGTRSVFYWGDQPDPSHCWMKLNYATADEDCYSHSFMEHLDKTNAFGLIDMLGLMGEWVEDDAHDYAWHDPSDGPYYSDDPKADGILRGGNFMYDWKFNRSATRIRCGDYGDSGISFRPALDLPDLGGESISAKPAHEPKPEAQESKPAKKWWKVW